MDEMESSAQAEPKKTKFGEYQFCIIIAGLLSDFGTH